MESDMRLESRTQAQKKDLKVGVKALRARPIQKEQEKKPKKKTDKKARTAKCEVQKGRYFFDETIYNGDFEAFADAEIARCKKRISEGYAVSTYQKKLKIIEEAKQDRRDIIEGNGGMPWETIQRLTTLTDIAKDLTENGDPYKELENVLAIISAYENNMLRFDGQVTYWCQGKQLEDPKAFDWADVRRLNTEENRGDGGFWVEGLFGPSPQRSNHRTYRVHSKNNERFAYLKVGIRLDHRLVERNTPDNEYPPTHEMEFLDDTGADGVHIFQDDLLELMLSEEKALPREAPTRHVLGYERIQLADNSFDSVLVVAMQINMWGEENGIKVPMRDKWEEMAVFVMPSNRVVCGHVGDRLMGNWTRSLFWVASAPSKRLQFLASTDKEGLKSIIPDVPKEDIKSYQPITRPSYGARWTRSHKDGEWIWGNPSRDYLSEGKMTRELIKTGIAKFPIAPPPAPSLIEFQSTASMSRDTSSTKNNDTDLKLPRPLIFPKVTSPQTSLDSSGIGNVGLRRPTVFPTMSSSSARKSPKSESESLETPMDNLGID